MLGRPMKPVSVPGLLEIEAIDAEAQVETAKQALAEAKRRAKQARSAADKAAEDARQREKKTSG